MMETFAVDGFPETKLVLALFRNVKNATYLKSKYLNRVALLDAGKHPGAAAPRAHLVAMPFTQQVHTSIQNIFTG